MAIFLPYCFHPYLGIHVAYILCIWRGVGRERWVHRVGRVLSFFSSRRNWDSPTPPSHPLVRRGRAHSLVGEGLGESQLRRGDIHCGTHKVLIYIEHHSVCPLVGIGTPPSECALPPVPKGGGAHSPAAKGVGESQFQRLEKRLALCLLCGGTLYIRICTLWVGRKGLS